MPKNINYGGFWIRLVAALIDFIIIYVGFAFIAVFIVFLLGELPEVSIGIQIFFGALYWLYHSLLQSSSWQATLGKKIFKMKVTDMEGNKLTFLRATGRYFSKYISAILLGIGFLMIAFTEKKQGLHDMIAKTLVIESKAVTKSQTPSEKKSGKFCSECGVKLEREAKFCSKCGAKQ